MFTGVLSPVYYVLKVRAVLIYDFLNFYIVLIGSSVLKNSDLTIKVIIIFTDWFVFELERLLNFPSLCSTHFRSY